VASDDELGVLTQSFSKMTKQLDDARRETERHRSRSRPSAYLESVLATSRPACCLRSRAALRAANAEPCHPARRPDELEKVPLAECRATRLAAAIIAPSGSVARMAAELELDEAARRRCCDARSTCPTPRRAPWWCSTTLPAHLGPAQRGLGEVAQRLATNQNPLTPSSSRRALADQARRKLEPASRDMLDRSIATIVASRGDENMVNDFRDYAKTPPRAWRPSISMRWCGKC